MDSIASQATSDGAERALVLFAHGSRDLLWHRPIQAVAQAILARSPSTRVACAYLELSQPDLVQVAAELAAQGVRHITVVPMFLGIGKHAREDLPVLVAQLQADYPGMVFRLTPAIGEHDRVIDMLAAVALQAASPT